MSYSICPDPGWTRSPFFVDGRVLCESLRTYWMSIKITFYGLGLCMIWSIVASKNGDISPGNSWNTTKDQQTWHQMISTRSGMVQKFIEVTEVARFKTTLWSDKSIGSIWQTLLWWTFKIDHMCSSFHQNQFWCVSSLALKHIVYCKLALQNHCCTSIYICKPHTLDTVRATLWRFPKNRGASKSSISIGCAIIQGLVNVLIEHHPTTGDIISNRYLKVMFKIPKFRDINPNPCYKPTILGYPHDDGTPPSHPFCCRVDSLISASYGW